MLRSLALRAGMCWLLLLDVGCNNSGNIGGGGDAGWLNVAGQNQNVSAQQNDQGRNAVQSETSFAVTQAQVNGPNRLIMAFNDNTGTFSDPQNDVFNNPASAMGWATSDDEGKTWIRQNQIAVPQGINIAVLISDPWLAVHGSTVLYAFDAEPTITPDATMAFAVLAVSTNAAMTFQPPRVVSGAAHSVDGPKVAISHDGTRAVVTWQTSQPRQIPGLNMPATVLPAEYVILDITNLPNLTPLRTGILDPIQRAPCPKFVGPNNCVVDCRFVTYTAKAHPIPAFGQGGPLYIGFTMYYSVASPQPLDVMGNACNAPPSSQKRHEVYRTADGGITWERVLSVPGAFPGNLLAVGMTDLTAVARAGTVPSLATARQNGHDVVVLAAAEIRPAVLPNEVSRQKVIVYRLPSADNCVVNPRDDSCSCGNCGPLAGYEADQSFQSHGKPWLANRPGIWQYQPALFSGQGNEDSRVGLVWYTQPKRGIGGTVAKPSLQVQMQTIVEGEISTDAGASFGQVITVTAKNGEADASWTDEIGQFFLPCETQPTVAPDTHYFGDYISGAFLDPDLMSQRAVASWADSRLNCPSQGGLGVTLHQHVYFGGVW